MRSLTIQECIAVNGAYQHNLNDGIMLSVAFSSVFGVAGAAAGIASYLGTASAASKGIALNAIFASANGLPVVTFPIALFAGLGFGGCVGAVVGLGLYYTGLLTKLETA